jgi:hypothetical protein
VCARTTKQNKQTMTTPSPTTIAVTFVGKNTNKLIAQAGVAESYNALAAQTRGTISAVHALHTFRNDVDANYVRGEVLLMDRDAPALALAPRLRELGGHISAIALPVGSLTSRTQCKEALTKNINAVLDDTVTTDSAVGAYTLRDGDSVQWKPTLEGPAEFVGVMGVQQRGGVISPYLVAHTNACTQSEELREFVEANPSMTIGQLMDSTMYKRLVNYAKRKNRLHLQAAAGAFGVQQHVRSAPDAEERGAPNDEHFCARDIASADIDTCYGTLRVSNGDSSKVAFYNRTVDLASSTGDGVLVPLSPLHGVQLYRFRSDVLLPGQCAPGSIVNNFENSLPVGLPVDENAVSADGVSQHYREEAHAVLHWPGKAVNAACDDKVYDKLSRHCEPEDVLSDYERVYLNGGRAVNDKTFGFTTQRLQPLAMLVRPDLQYATTKQQQ